MPNARAAAPDPVALVGRLASRGLTGTQIVQELKARHGLRLSASAVAAILKRAGAAASPAKAKAAKAKAAHATAAKGKKRTAKAEKPAKSKNAAVTPRKAAVNKVAIAKAAPGKAAPGNGAAPKPATNGAAAAPAKPPVNGHAKGPANGIAALPVKLAVAKVSIARPTKPVAPTMLKPAVKPAAKPPAQPGSIGALGAMQCAFPITLDRPFKFCGNRVAGLRIAGQAGATSPYCALHHEQCYQRKGSSGPSRSSLSAGIKPIGR